MMELKSKILLMFALAGLLIGVGCENTNVNADETVERESGEIGNDSKEIPSSWRLYRNLEYQFELRLSSGLAVERGLFDRDPELFLL